MRLACRVAVVNGDGGVSSDSVSASVAADAAAARSFEKPALVFYFSVSFDDRVLRRDTTAILSGGDTDDLRTFSSMCFSKFAMRLWTPPFKQAFRRWHCWRTNKVVYRNKPVV